MAKQTRLTEYAHVACSELRDLNFVCSLLTHDLRSDEEKLQRRNREFPELDPISNDRFNRAAFNFLGTFQFCRSVDIYNWYCREALRLALSENAPAVLAALKDQKSLAAKLIKKAVAQKRDAAVEIIKKLLSDRYTGDHAVRTIIHQNLKIHQYSEVEVLCICRNLLVHRRGVDEFGQLKRALVELAPRGTPRSIALFPGGRFPIELDAGNSLVVDDSVGAWAANFLDDQVLMMDEHFACVYELSRKVYRPVSLRRMALDRPL